jgi:hypothetical protein
LAGIRARILSLQAIGFQGSFWGLCLCPAKSRFPTAKAGVGEDSMMSPAARRVQDAAFLFVGCFEKRALNCEIPAALG